MAETQEPNTVINSMDSKVEPYTDLSLNANTQAEIDTSVPFESVREAASRFGGFGFWKPSHHFKENNEEEEDEIMRIKAEASELQNDLIAKESETIKLLKELKSTKDNVETLSFKLKQSNEQEEECYVVLKDLNQAKLNLCETTIDLASVRAYVEVLSKLVKEEREKLAKTRERIVEKSMKVASLEEEEARVRLAKAEVERSRDELITVRMKLLAARKMKDAAKAGEAVAIAEIKALTASENVCAEEVVNVTISYEEYDVLVRKAREAEEEARKQVEDATLKVEEANVSKKEVFRKADEASQEVEISKRVLEEAMERADVANDKKLEAEEAFRNWRSENGQRRRSSVNNTAKFKNRSGLNLTYDVNVLTPTMSIGEILKKKLLLAEDSNTNVATNRRKMSLGQMLANNGNNDRTASKMSNRKENEKKSVTRKRKKFGFAKISVLLNKESKNKNKKDRF